MSQPDGFAPLFATGVPTPIGAVAPAVAAALGGIAAARGDGYGLPAAGAGLAEALEAARERLAAADLAGAPREEAIDVRAAADGPALAAVDRSAARPLGLLVDKVCLIAREARTGRFVLGRRGRGARVAPGKLDLTAAGGVAAGASLAETLREEAHEEARLPAEVVAAAVETRRLQRIEPTARGLARERLVVYELDLPEGVAPRALGEEIEGFLAATPAELAALLAAPGTFKPSAAIVLRDALARRRRA